MTESNLRAELDESHGLRRAGRVPAEPEVLRRAPQQRRVSERFGRSQGQQPSGVDRQRPQPLPEPVFQTPDRSSLRCVRQSLHELCRCPRVRKLQEREWISATLGENALPNSRIGRACDHRAEQNVRVGIAEPSKPKFRQAEKGSAIRRVSLRDQQHDLLSQQAMSYELDGLQRHTVEPLRVVDDHQHRLVLGQAGQQLQRGQAYQEPARRRTDAEPEHGRERGALGRRERGYEIDERPAQLLQPRRTEARPPTRRRTRASP